MSTCDPRNTTDSQHSNGSYTAEAASVSQPIAVDAPGVARLLGISERMVRKLNLRGELPRAARLGRRRVWLVEELKLWMRIGCPHRDLWERMKRGAS